MSNIGTRTPTFRDSTLSASHCVCSLSPSPLLYASRGVRRTAVSTTYIRSFHCTRVNGRLGPVVKEYVRTNKIPTLNPNRVILKPSKEAWRGKRDDEYTYCRGCVRVIPGQHRFTKACLWWSLPAVRGTFRFCHLRGERILIPQL